MSDQRLELELTEKDQKKLRFHRNVNLFLGGFLWIPTGIMLVLGSYLGLVEGELVGKVMLAVGAGIFLFAWRLRKNYLQFKSDMKGGVKTAVQGTLESKTRYRSSCLFKINGRTYPVHIDYYLEFEKGDEVFIAFGPASSMILNVKKIREEPEA